MIRKLILYEEGMRKQERDLSKEKEIKVFFLKENEVESILSYILSQEECTYTESYRALWVLADMILSQKIILDHEGRTSIFTGEVIKQQEELLQKPTLEQLSFMSYMKSWHILQMSSVPENKYSDLIQEGLLLLKKLLNLKRLNCFKEEEAYKTFIKKYRMRVKELSKSYIDLNELMRG